MTNKRLSVTNTNVPKIARDIFPKPPMQNGLSLGFNDNWGKFITLLHLCISSAIAIFG